ncbi:MAG TPA: ATP-grasp domain-containing protein [Mycobacteriales bacterium]|nr:ATP-grasp domain-containing protein [Mycobacteriales bacterium]
MRIVLLAVKPTCSVTEGFLPAAHRLGSRVILLTDRPAAHAAAYAGWPAGPAEIIGCDVRDPRAVIDRVSRLGRPDAVFSNSDHLQTQAALAADYLGLPGKDWRATLRAKHKPLMRRHLAGLDPVYAVPLGPTDDPARLPDPPFPCVLKPAEGVASEDVVLVGDAAELAARTGEVRARRPGETLLVEEFLAGPLHTLETVGDTSGLGVLGGFRTELSPPPYFVEERMAWPGELPGTVRDRVLGSVLGQLRALGVGLGACHTEFVRQGDRARLVEVNYRIIGDQCDLLLAEMLELPLFEQVLRAHLGEPVTAEIPPWPGTGRQVGGPHARIEWALVSRSGTLVAAPGPVDAETAGVRLAYRPLRRVGERVALTHTNRDYLGVLRAYGADPGAVDRVVAAFWAGRRWDIEP